MNERACIQELRVAARDLQRAADRQRAVTVDDAGSPVVATADRVGTATQQRAATVKQRGCNACTIGQIQRAAAQRKRAGSGHAACCGKRGRGTPDVERTARGELLCATQQRHAIDAQRALLNIQRTALICRQAAVVAEVERAGAGLCHRAEILETAAGTGALVDVQRVVVVLGFQGQQCARGVLQQRAIVQQQAAAVVVADATVAG